ncbi:MAG: hypothetical protein R3B99_23825 [Polyangiales bacterium]
MRAEPYARRELLAAQPKPEVVRAGVTREKRLQPSVSEARATSRSKTICPCWGALSPKSEV